MVQQPKPFRKHVCAVAPSRNYTLFDILLALAVLLFLFVSWNTAGAASLPADDPVDPTPVCVTIEPDGIGCLIPPVTWVAPTATPVASPTIRPFEPTATPGSTGSPTPTIVATDAGPAEPTATATAMPTLQPISRCSVLHCLFLPIGNRGQS